MSSSFAIFGVQFIPSLGHLQLPLQASVAVIKHHAPKQLGEDRICFILPLVIHYEAKSGQELKEGSWRQERSRDHGRTLLIWLPRVCSGCFLIKPRATCPGVVLIMSTIHQRNAPTILHTCQSEGGIFFQLNCPLPRQLWIVSS